MRIDYKKKTFFLILVATLVRCAIACSVELGNDEVYYRMYAQYMQWNYFDHPPMVGWLIRITTADLWLDNEFFIRLGAILSAALTTWLLFLSGKKLGNDYTGFLAALIYTATIYGSIIAGTFILPDSPQMVCWTGSLYLLISVSENTTIDVSKKLHLICFGFVAGIGMLCKIHTAFLWLGFFLFVIFYNRKWLGEPVFYFSGLITLLFFLPVIKWNIDNHFITYLYHSKRINVASGGFNFSSFFSFLAGQVFYCNPVIFPFIILAIITASSNRLKLPPAQKQLLLLCSLPLPAITIVISFFKEVLPHWPLPAYSGLILLTACYFTNRTSKNNFQKRLVPKPIAAALVFLLTTIICGVLLINYLPGTLAKKKDPFLGEGDFTLDMFGWRKIKSSFADIVTNDEQSGRMSKNAIILSNKWFSAAHVDFYIGMPLQKDVIAIGDTADIHQYAWFNKNRKTLHTGDDAYCIVPSENYFEVKDNYASLFETILPPAVLEQKRNGQTCRKIYVYRLKNYLGNQKTAYKTR